MHYQIIKNKIESYTAGTFGGTSSSALFAINIRLLAGLVPVGERNV